MLATAWSLLRQTVSEWSEDGAPRLGAALAYYSVFSIGPLLLIAIGIASVVFDSAQVEGQVLDQVGRLVGAKGAEAVKAMVANASIGNQSLFGTLIGVALLLFGAIAVVVQLKDALNIIWDVEEAPASGIWGYVRKYVISLAAVLGFGFLLTVSLVTTAVLSAAANIWGPWVPQGTLTLVNFAVDLGVLTLLFAMMFKWLPDTEIAWRDVWIGAALTSLLFILGKFLIAFYLGRQGLEIDLRRRVLDRAGAGLDLLFGADRVLRSRIHPGLCAAAGIPFRHSARPPGFRGPVARGVGPSTFRPSRSRPDPTLCRGHRRRRDGGRHRRDDRRPHQGQLRRR